MPADSSPRTPLPLHEQVRCHALRTPDKTALVWYGQTISYAELVQLSERCATVLTELGVEAGEPVALFMQNCPQYVIAHLGIQKLGALVSPCSPLFKSQELSYQLGDLGARVVIAADDLYPILEEIDSTARPRHVLLVHYEDMLPSTATYPVPAEIRYARTMPAGTIDLLSAIDATVAAQDTRPWHVAHLDDPALIVYTSGTSGRPKGAVLTLGNAWFKTDGLATLARLDANAVHLAIPPLYHISGMLYGLDLPLHCGATVVLHYRFDARAAIESIERHRVTYWKAIAPMLVALLDLPDASRYDMSSLQVTSASSFGIRMTEALSRRWAALTGGCIATEAGYGLTETHTADVVTLPREVRWGTNGRLMPGVQCRIVDPQSGVEQAPGAHGEIWLRSPGCFQGYWKQPEKTADTLIDGWVRTGDIGSLDADGYLTLHGRTKELIKVSGYSVFPDDVEALISAHPLVHQVAVLGVPDPTRGEVVKAVVVLREGMAGALSADDLIRWSRENMSAYKVPRHIEFRAKLPATASGKILRRLL